MAEPIVYTTSTCPYCHYVKDFLNREGIKFQEKNVEIDRKAAQDMVNLTGQQGVPVTVIAGQTIIGFNQPALKTAVGKLRANINGNGVRLGASVADASTILARQGKTARSGAILGQVASGSTASKAGLREGDIIVRLNGQAVSGPTDLAKALQNLGSQPVSQPNLTFWRDDVEMTCTIK